MRESRLSGSVEGVMSDHDSYSDSHPNWSAAVSARIPEKFGPRICLFGKFERKGAPPLPRLLRVNVPLVGILDFNFMYMQEDHRTATVSCQSQIALARLRIWVEKPTHARLEKPNTKGAPPVLDGQWPPPLSSRTMSLTNFLASPKSIMVLSR